MPEIEKVSIESIKKDKGFEMPEHFPYELPFGVVADETICEDVKNYGLLFWKHVLYVIGGKKTVAKNEIQYFKAVSNFSIEIMQHMEDEKRPMRLVKLHSIHRRKRIFECESHNFTVMGKFLNIVEEKGNYQFTGNAGDYSRLKAYLMDKMGDGRMIEVLGWQPEGFFAFNNAAVDSKVHHYSGFGGLEYNDENYYIRSANSIYANNHNKYKNQKKVLYVDSGIRFAEWNKQMNLVYKEPAMLMITFAVACLFSDHIFKIHGFFPMVFLYGEAGTGKTKMVEQIQTLFGTPQNAMPLTGANTDKAQVRKFAQFVNMLVFLEEFRNTADTKLTEMLKGLHGRNGYERGNIESDYGTDSVPISSGVVITGNDYPSNDPLLTRLIVAEMNQNEFKDEERANFSKMQDMELEGYSSIIQEIIIHREYFVAEYFKTYKDVKKEVAFKMDGLNLVDRNIENMSVLVTVYTVMFKKLAFSFSKKELFNALQEMMRKQSMKRDVGGEVSVFWEIFSQLMKDKLIPVIANEDYKIEGDWIFIRFSRVVNNYSQKHYLNYKKTGLTKNSLRDKLMNHNAFEANVKACRIGSSTSTAMQFDLNKIDTESRDNILIDWYKIMTDENPDKKRAFKKFLVQKGLMEDKF